MDDKNLSVEYVNEFIFLSYFEISSLIRQKEELLELNQKGAEIIEENQLKIAQLEKQNCSDDSEYIFHEVNYLENLGARFFWHF